MKKIILTSLLCMGLIAPMADAWAVSWHIMSDDGTKSIEPSATPCGGAEMSAGAFGVIGTPVNNKKRKSKSTKLQLWIARDVVEHGAYFCPTELRPSYDYCELGRGMNAYDIIGGKCYWVCRDGWGGDKCATQDAGVIDTARIVVPTGGTGANVNVTGAAFYNDKKNNCDHKNRTRTYGWLIGQPTEDGHGMLFQPYTVRTKYVKEDHCYVNPPLSLVMKAVDTKQRLLCMSGYIDDGTGTKCTLACPPGQDCDVVAADYCPYAPAAQYDPSIHTFKTEMKEDGTIKCKYYVCSDSKSGFPAAEKYTCEECLNDPKYITGGQNEKNGLCVRCEKGKIFDEETFECKDTTELSKSDMQYGRGQTRQSVGVDVEVEKYCWTNNDMEQYDHCVTGRSPSGT